MIDYLTPLVEEEETAVELDGSPWVEAVRREAREEVEPVEKMSVAGEDAGVPWREETVENGELEAMEEAGNEVPWLEGPVRRGSGAAGLARKLRRAGRVSRVALEGGGRTVAVTVPETAGSGKVGMDLLELDRAVQRDARRYDGGFSLF